MTGKVTAEVSDSRLKCDGRNFFVRIGRIKNIFTWLDVKSYLTETKFIRLCIFPTMSKVLSNITLLSFHFLNHQSVWFLIPIVLMSKISYTLAAESIPCCKYIFPLLVLWSQMFQCKLTKLAYFSKADFKFCPE